MLIFLCFHKPALGQDAEAGRNIQRNIANPAPQLILKVGLLLSTIDKLGSSSFVYGSLVNGSRNISLKSGVTIGAEFNMKLFQIKENNIFVRTGFNYVEKGYNYSLAYRVVDVYGSYMLRGVIYPLIKTYSVDEQTEVRLSYIELPVLLDFYFGKKKNFLASAGGYFGFALPMKTSTDRKYNGSSGSGTHDDTNSPTSDQHNYGLQFGIGFIASKRIRLDLFYAFGLKKLEWPGYTKLMPGYNFEENTKNKSFGFSVGFPVTLLKSK